ncbi:MAG: hypothetical protein AB8H86_20770 [Polyangiales bacterium]
MNRNQRLVVFTFEAEVEDDTGKGVDASLLHQLDGIADCLDLKDNVLPEELNIGIVEAVPTLRFDRKRSQLLLEIAIHTDRVARPIDVEELADFCRYQIDSVWGLNYDFDLPSSLADCHVTFSSEPREAIPEVRADGMADAIKGWKVWDYERVAATSSAELEALQARLRPFVMVDYRRGGLARKVLDLSDSVTPQLQRRALAKSEHPKVTLDATDDLPRDVF